MEYVNVIYGIYFLLLLFVVYDSDVLYRKLSERQRKLLQDLREEEEKLEGKSSSSSSADASEASRDASDASGKKGRSKSSYSSGTGSSNSGGGSDDDRGGIGGFMQDAFDRVKSHLAGKEKASSSGSSS